MAKARATRLDYVASVSVWSGWTGGNPLQTFQLIPIRVQNNPND